MDLQVFLLRPNDEFDESKIKNTTPQTGKAQVKPPGFWTSSLKGQSSDWLDWCRWEMPHWIGKRAAIFKVRPGARIYEIVSAPDYYDLWRAFPLESNTGFTFGSHPVDWGKVARKYDGVHLHSDLGRGGVDDLYGWDVESSVWFKPKKALEFLKMVDVEKGEKGPDDDEWDMPECVLRVASRWRNRLDQ